MSLYVLRSSLFDLSPRIWVERGQLHARSSLLVQALTLFAFCRYVHVDARQRVVWIDRRYLWFFHATRSVRFEQVRHVEYGFARLWLDWTAWGQPTDQWETFKVSLALRDPDEELLLLRFRGLGSIGTGFYGVLFGGDSIVDVEGAQQSTSLAFIEALQDLLGVRLGESLPMPRDAQQQAWACSACKRPAPPRPGKCLYCGAERVVAATR